MKSVRLLLLSFFVLFLSGGCGSHRAVKTTDIVVFHAGSLSVPFLQLKNEYEKANPNVRILLEPAGSIVCARKITELKKDCDLMASADYFVIDKMLIPEYADWSIKFATNEIVLAYNSKSKYAPEINSNNWIDVLLRKDVIYGRSDPDKDPCGYRTVFTFLLAEKYYKISGLAQKLISRNSNFIRPKEVDLVALIESDAIDYMFQYKSVAIQHGLKFIELPAEINLSDPSRESEYQSVSLEVTGSKPDTKMKVTGDFINYSLTIPKNATNQEAAIDFVCYLLSEKGMDVFSKNGQNFLVPFISDQPDKLPGKIRNLIKQPKAN